MRPQAAPGQESVWAYPRPAVAEPTLKRLRIVHRGVIVAAPTADFTILKDHVAFYAWPFDQCTVDGEQVTSQPGGLYGGWITSREAGPFKGVPGSRSW